MTTSSTPLTASSGPGLRAPRWARSLSWRATGRLILLLALLFTCVSYLLASQLDYPEILIEKPSFATALVAHAQGTGLAGFLGLLLCGVLLVVISVRLAYHLQGRAFRRIFVCGGAAGTLWAAAGALGIVLLLFWDSTGAASTAQVIAALILVFAELVAPLLLVLWTWTLGRQLQALKGLSFVGAIGLLLVFLRSLFWIINALVPIEAGFYATAGILNILAVLGESLWLLWLFLLGFLLMRRGKEPVGTVEAQSGKPIGRRRFLKAAVGLAAVLAGAAFVGGRTGLTIANQPALEGDDIPAEPSFMGTLFYLIAWVYLKILSPIHTIAQQKSTFSSSAMPLPPGVKLEKVDAGGVPSERVVAPGAGSRRWIFYTHGGGWAQGITDSHRSFVAKLSQATGASGLLPDYRLTPEHPFPAGLNDCVTAYRWLLSQGVAASQIAIAGESAGGNLALATTLSVRGSGDALPAVLVAISPATDMAMTGETFQAKAFVDPILGAGLPQDAYTLYTNHGATDPRNPLVSPLYADVHGMPPTLLQVGTQEVLLSDSTRMADRLKAAGVETKLEVWPGMFHAFSAGSDFIPEGRLAAQHIVKFIRQHLGA
jgi:acetyl esterase/lipase